ncbi:MAG: hypothetical protein AB1633_06450 [Elusimicrobiota bacterium]
MKKKTANKKKKQTCICPFCESEITCISPAGTTFCKPCGINFITCGSCGEIMMESQTVCIKCGWDASSGRKVKPRKSVKTHKVYSATTRHNFENFANPQILFNL